MISRRTVKGSVLALIAASIVAIGATAQSAEASASSFWSGSPGLWLGESSGPKCYPSGMYIQSGAPNVGRSSASAGYTQQVYMLPVLEYLNPSGGWSSYTAGDWQRVDLAPGYFAKFTYYRFWTLPHGVAWRVGYHFLWYVGNSKQIGEAWTYNTSDEWSLVNSSIFSLNTGYSYIFGTPNPGGCVLG